MAEEPPKIDFVAPDPVLWAWRCPNDGVLHWYHNEKTCNCGFTLTSQPPGSLNPIGKDGNDG